MPPAAQPPESSVPTGKMPVTSNTPQPAVLPHALSVDVEDYYHVEAFADRIRPEMWPQFPSRVVQNTQRVLKLLEESGSRATFFVLGWVAEKAPGLIREILAAGHEVGCHSHLHQRVFTMTPQDFRLDLRRACRAIEDAGGSEVTGFRAPTFSITEKSLWAIEILAEEGFRYDSSVFPIRHDLGGMPHAPRFPFRWVCRDGRSLFEIPPLTVRLFGRNFPAGGGGYLRILPMWYTRWALRRVRERDGRPAVLYFHPWEIDPEQPRLSGSLKSKFRHYSNLRGMEQRVRDILGHRSFVSLRTLLDQLISTDQIPAEQTTRACPRPT